MALVKILRELMDTPGDGGAGGGSTGAGASGQQQTSQSNGQATQTTQAQQTTSQQTNASGQAASPTDKTFTYKEDRTDWIPRHRFNEYGQENQTLKTQLAERDRQIAALTGSQTPDANTQKAETIKEAFFNLPGMGIFRKLASLTEEQLDAVLETPNHVAVAQQAEARQWIKHGDQVASDLSQRVADAIGAESLDDEQKNDLRLSFRAWLIQVGEKEQRENFERTGRKFSQTVKRYEDGDPKLLDEFASRYVKNWVEPARRQSTANSFNRTRPVPNGGGRTPVTSTVKKPEKFNSLDERIQYAADLAKERGVQFGR